MKKRMSNLLILISLIIGGAVGYVRSDIFLKHYDSFTGVILNSASSALTILTVFLVIFAVMTYLFSKKMVSDCQLSPRMGNVGKIFTAVGSLFIAVSALFALINPDGGFFEKTFAISAVIAIVYFVMVMLSVRTTMTDLLSCASVLPAVLVLLSIYKTNIRFPNISLFAFEVLAALFLMLGFYYISAMNFRNVNASLPVWVTSLAAMFSISAIVTHTMVLKNYLFTPVTSQFSILYFIGALLVLAGFTYSLQDKKQEMVIFNGIPGFIITNGEDELSFDERGDNVFLSHKPDRAYTNAVCAEDGSDYTSGDFSVTGFLFDGQNQSVYGQHITTPNGVTLLNLVCGTSDNVSEKLAKKLSAEFGKVDYIVVMDGEHTPSLLSIVNEKIKHSHILVLTSEDNMESLNEKMVFTNQGQFIL